MSKVLVSLVGHQPLPTLMVARHLKPDKVILMSTDEQAIKDRRENLEYLLRKEERPAGGFVEVIKPATVAPWNVLSIVQWMENEVLPEQTEPKDRLIYDVTGGTKAMSIGLARVGSKRDGELIYVDSSGQVTQLWRYHIVRNEQGQDIGLYGGKPEPLMRYLKISDLFLSYLGKKFMEEHVIVKERQPPQNRGDYFEDAVHQKFATLVDDTCQSVQIHGRQQEIDIVLQKGNKFALVECKSGGLNSMDGIKQLNNLASERYLGTFTSKILACVGVKDATLKEIAEQHNIHILDLPDWEQDSSWNAIDNSAFDRAIEAAFGS